MQRKPTRSLIKLYLCGGRMVEEILGGSLVNSPTVSSTKNPIRQISGFGYIEKLGPQSEQLLKL